MSDSSDEWSDLGDTASPSSSDVEYDLPESPGIGVEVQQPRTHRRLQGPLNRQEEYRFLPEICMNEYEEPDEGPKFELAKRLYKIWVDTGDRKRNTPLEECKNAMDHPKIRFSLAFGTFLTRKCILLLGTRRHLKNPNTLMAKLIASKVELIAHYTNHAQHMDPFEQGFKDRKCTLRSLLKNSHYFSRIRECLIHINPALEGPCNPNAPVGDDLQLFRFLKRRDTDLWAITMYKRYKSHYEALGYDFEAHVRY